jgi:hypothetical protein
MSGFQSSTGVAHAERHGWRNVATVALLRAIETPTAR